MAAGFRPLASADTDVLPTGTVTFAFTDIEGSTARWERNRAAMREALHRHNTILRAAIEQHGGRVFKTVGDAFCAAFARADDAVAAMAAAQQTLVAEDFSVIDGLRVRAAIHTGLADERDGDYFGPTVNRVARLTAIGHGGQILISGVTRDLAHESLPDGTTLVDLGLQRLQDLTEPEHVWQLSIAGLPDEFPPLRSLDTLPNNLPIQRTTFVGREHDVADVKELLERHRLLTLVGAGGVGKTRLAIQAGAEMLDRYPDGVWFVDFAPISDPELVASVVAQALGMSQQQGRRVDESIPAWLRRKKLLVIFDNCEHVLEPAAALADAILARTQDVRILATSRQRLDVSGEAVHRLPSLPLPAEAAALKTDEAVRYGAIALFVDRAKLADTRFTLTDDTAPIVAEICRHLDGIPLAIELAAARVKVLSILHLAQRLNERFKILSGGSRAALPRQKTLTATIDWSYELLTPQEQRLFNKLGIFAGGFGLDAVAAVCGGEGLDELDILDLLASLTDKSLIAADTSGKTERYRLLESTAAYALEKLAASRDRERMARRHAEYFREQAEAAHDRSGSGSRIALLAGIELELDNYRVALEWALRQGNDAVLGGAIAGALPWLSTGLAVEGRYWIALALPRISDAEQPAIAARLQFALSYLLSGKRSYGAAERAMQLYESVGDRPGAARAQRKRGGALFQMGQLEEARATITQALAASRACGNASSVASCQNLLAAIEKERGDLGAARELRAQALAAWRSLGDEVGASHVLGNMAESEFAAGDPEQALCLANEALEIHLRGKNAVNIATWYSTIAAYRIALDDLEGAHKSAREGLRFARQAQHELLISIALQHLALLAALGGDPRRGAQLLGYVNAQFDRLGTQREHTEQWGHDKLLAALRETLSDDQIKSLATEGAAWSEDQTVEQALKV
ncbi:MAG TPA: adenylate/guanylate cyclase domain-containing protein [Candidatus Cybelea sp.]